MTLTILVPTLPLIALSPNGPHGTHYGAVSAARETLRAEVTVDALGELQRLGLSASWVPLAHSRVGIELRVCRKRLGDDGYYRPRDTPNMVSAMKPTFDALQDAGVIVGDDAKHMELGEHRIVEVPTRAEEGIVITIEEVE